MRLRMLLVVAIASLAAVASAGAADRVVERGIIQSVSPTAVVLRALDGTELTLTLTPTTRYRLNGGEVTLAEIRPGLVAEAVTSGTGPALVLRAFGPMERGVLARIRAGTLVLRRAEGGGTTRIRLTRRTTVWQDGTEVGLRSLRTGMRLDVILAANGTARVVLIRRARG